MEIGQRINAVVSSWPIRRDDAEDLGGTSRNADDRKWESQTNWSRAGFRGDLIQAEELRVRSACGEVQNGIRQDIGIHFDEHYGASRRIRGGRATVRRARRK